MKRTLSTLLALALLVTWVGLVAADDSAADKKPVKKRGAVLAEVVTVTATVDAVDAAKRAVTFKLSDGATKTVKLGPEVKNFDQIKAGDKLKATYYESVAVFVRRADDKASEFEAGTVKVAPKGAKPAILVADTSEIVAKVEAIDYKNRTVTVKGPEGRSATFTVDKRVKRFMALKVGDDLVARVTDAMAVAVEAP